MPAIAAITINDGKTTPVAHVFAPVTTNGSVASLANRAATIPQGYENLSVTVRDPGKSKEASYRMTGFLTLPTVAAVEGTDTVVRSSKSDFAFSFSQTSTAQERLDLLALTANFLASATAKTMAQNLEPLY